MTELLVLFATSVLWIFVAAFQSRNVNTGQYAWAAATSFSLGLFQVQVLAAVVGPHGSLLHTLTYCIGGAVGVTTAMWVHRRFLHPPEGTPT